MDRRERAVLIAFIALATLLRFATLDAKSFWQDEAGTAFVARLNILSMLHAISGHETTPPLYFLLTSGWIKLFGSGEVGMRSLAALFGVGPASLPST